jgi:hypothetical protein
MSILPVARPVLIALAVLLPLREREPPEPDTWPQFPSAAVCEKHSWQAWYWHEYFRGLCERGWGNDDTGILARCNYHDSYLWWDLHIVQSPTARADERAAAQERVIEQIGPDAFRAGLVPTVVPFPLPRP